MLPRCGADCRHLGLPYQEDWTWTTTGTQVTTTGICFVFTSNFCISILKWEHQTGEFYDEFFSLFEI